MENATTTLVIQLRYDEKSMMETIAFMRLDRY